MGKSKQANAAAKGRNYESLARKWNRDCWGFESFDPAGGIGGEGSDIGFEDIRWLRGEAKSHKAMALSSWLKQAVDQAESEGSQIGYVHHKKKGVGNSIEIDGGIGHHYVTLRASDFAWILKTMKDHDIKTLSEKPTAVEEAFGGRKSSTEDLTLF